MPKYINQLVVASICFMEGNMTQIWTELPRNTTFTISVNQLQVLVVKRY